MTCVYVMKHVRCRFVTIISEFGRFYAVRKGNEWYRPTVLPMGSRHGPSLAQTTALAIIAFRLRVPGAAKKKT